MDIALSDNKQPSSCLGRDVTGIQRVFALGVSYLNGGHPELLANQDLSPLQLGNPGLLHLHEVLYQLRDVHLPI